MAEALRGTDAPTLSTASNQERILGQPADMDRSEIDTVDKDDSDSVTKEPVGDDAVPDGSEARRDFKQWIASVALPIYELLNAQIGHNVSSFIRERQPVVWLIALFLGVAVAYVAVGFRWSIGLLQLPWLGTSSE